MDLFEISIGEFVTLLGILVLFIVNAQMPFTIFSVSMLLDEFVLLLRGWFVFAPRIAVILHDLASVDEPLAVLEV